MIIQNITLSNVGFVTDVPALVTSGLFANYDATTGGVSGSTFSDSSGNGRNATIYASAATTTYNATTVLRLNSASSQYFGYTTGYATSLDSAYTYEVWAYPLSASTAGTLVGEWGVSTFNGGWTDAQMGFTTTKINAGYYQGGGVVGTNWSANTWYHILFTYASSLGTLYINAASQGTTSATKENPGATFLTIGKDDNSNGIYLGGVQNYFNGYIGSFRIYDRALNSAEVTQNYNAAKWKYGL